MRSFSNIKTVGWSHRASTRDRARQTAVAHQIAEDLAQSVSTADIVILATPICTFESLFGKIAAALPAGCIVTDVGSTKAEAAAWAKQKLPRRVSYIGSHPIAGSEQRGVEFARDDLFDSAACIITPEPDSDQEALSILENFWRGIGCEVKIMSCAEHDRVFADISHLPHALAAALIMASDETTMRYAGTGFMDTSRVASGPANIWADVFLTNAPNVAAGIDRVIAQLEKLKQTMVKADRQELEKLLSQARDKRTKLVNYKMKKRELT